MKLDPADFPGLTVLQVQRLERMAIDAGRELRAIHQPRHNHFTRDIKPRDSDCLACVAYWISQDILAQPKGPVCPECRDGKHGNCIGYALNAETDVVEDCACAQTHPE